MTTKGIAGSSTPGWQAQIGKGRKKGVPNKATTLAKTAIAEAAERLGGVDRLVKWCKEAPENERVFWGSIYPKLLPLQVTGEDGGAIKLQIIERVIVDPANPDS